MYAALRHLDRFRPLAPLILRVVIGGLFVWHGIDKFDTGLSMVEGAFESWGVPVPSVSAPLSAIIELVAGAALIFGIGTRVAAAALSFVMVMAIIYVKADLGIISSTPMPGAELDLSLLAGTIALMFIGPGPYSADAMIGIDSAQSAELDRAAEVGQPAASRRAA